LTEPISILLVDDEPLILMDLEFAAEDRGFKPCCASCVSEAMALIEDGVDVAVLDFNLVGGENCLPIARELRNARSPISSIRVTRTGKKKSSKCWTRSTSPSRHLPTRSSPPR